MQAMWDFMWDFWEGSLPSGSRLSFRPGVARIYKEIPRFFHIFTSQWEEKAKAEEPKPDSRPARPLRWMSRRGASQKLLRDLAGNPPRPCEGSRPRFPVKAIKRFDGAESER
jgi:hypothetical protein